MQAFTDLVGTATLPAHAFDVAELTELTPALDAATAAHDTAEQASEASAMISTLGYVHFYPNGCL